jgi:predicted MFS family arabinose efflux permease
MSIYMLAGPLASLLSFGIGGRLNEIYGWRVTFFLMGIPALAIALLVKLTVREPRMQVREAPAPVSRAPRTLDVVKIIWCQRSSRHLNIGLVLLFLMGYGLVPWYAAFMMRSLDMRTGEVGIWLGLIFGISGIAGILSGGYITGKWLAQREPLQMRLSALTVALLVPGLAAFLMLPQKHAALAALALLCVTWGFCYGPVYALMQRLVRDEIRATTLAITMLFANLIGMGVGPQLVGVLSDAFAPRLGSDALRYAMLVTSLVALWAAYHFWQVGKTVRHDLASVARS